MHPPDKQNPSHRLTNEALTPKSSVGVLVRKEARAKTAARPRPNRQVYGMDTGGADSTSTITILPPPPLSGVRQWLELVGAGVGGHGHGHGHGHGSNPSGWQAGHAQCRSIALCHAELNVLQAGPHPEDGPSA